LITHGGEAAQVKTISMDMSPAFIKGADARFPNAQKIFDKFHIVKMFNSAVDKVRKQEHKGSFDI
jgi:transposase